MQSFSRDPYWVNLVCLALTKCCLESGRLSEVKSQTFEVLVHLALRRGDQATGTPCRPQMTLRLQGKGSICAAQGQKGNKNRPVMKWNTIVYVDVRLFHLFLSFICFYVFCLLVWNSAIYWRGTCKRFSSFSFIKPDIWTGVWSPVCLDGFEQECISVKFVLGGETFLPIQVPVLWKTHKGNTFPLWATFNISSSYSHPNILGFPEALQPCSWRNKFKCSEEENKKQKRHTLYCITDLLRVQCFQVYSYNDAWFRKCRESISATVCLGWTL